MNTKREIWQDAIMMTVAAHSQKVTLVAKHYIIVSLARIYLASKLEYAFPVLFIVIPDMFLKTCTLKEIFAVIVAIPISLRHSVVPCGRKKMM